MTFYTFPTIDPEEFLSAEEALNAWIESFDLALTEEDEEALYQFTNWQSTAAHNIDALAHGAMYAGIDLSGYPLPVLHAEAVYAVVIHQPGCLPNTSPTLTASLLEAIMLLRADVNWAIDALEDDETFLKYSTDFHTETEFTILSSIAENTVYSFYVEGTRYAIERAN